MLFLVISIILTVLSFLYIGIEIIPIKDQYGDVVDKKFVWKLKPKQCLSLLCLVICAFGFITKVPENNVGIVYSPFGGTKEATLSEGYAKKSPLDKVYNISTEVQTVTIEDLTTQTKDAQYLSTDLDVKYQVSKDTAFLIFKQYKTLNKMSDTLIVPTTQRVLELVTTKYNVIDILGEKRPDVYAELGDALKEEFAKYGVEFYSVSISDMDAGAALEKAIADEAVAKKAVETAEQNLLKTETEAKAQAVKAKAEQDAAKIKAETKLINARAEKEANELLNKSLSDKVLSKEWIDKWDGKMPTYYGGSGEGIMFNVGN